MVINNGCNLPFSNLIWLQPFVPRDQLFLYHRTANKNQTSYNYIYTLYVEYCNPHFLWVRPSCLLLLWQSEQSCEQTTTVVRHLALCLFFYNLIESVKDRTLFLGKWRTKPDQSDQHTQPCKKIISQGIYSKHLITRLMFHPCCKTWLDWHELPYFPFWLNNTMGGSSPL